jgi:hypothetical protein
MPSTISASDFFDDVAAISIDGDQLRSFGSGRLVAKGLILTAGHVVDIPSRDSRAENGWRVRLLRDRGRNDLWEKGYDAQVIWRAKPDEFTTIDADLALLRIVGTDIEPKFRLKLTRFDALSVLDVFATGFPRATVDEQKKSREYRVPGRLMVVSQIDPLRFAVEDASKPANATDWQGISGGLVVCEFGEALHLFGVLRDVQPQFNGGQLGVTPCADAFADGKFVEELQKALGEEPSLLEWGQNKPSSAKVPPSEVIYLVDRRPQEERLKAVLPAPLPSHGVIVCAVRGATADVPLEFPQSLVEYMAPSSDPRLFPIVRWPTFGSGNASSDRGLMWEDLRGQLPLCRFDPVEGFQSARDIDAQMKSLSNSARLAGGINYPIAVSASGLSKDTVELVKAELGLWGSLARWRTSNISTGAIKGYPPFLVLLYFILDENSEATSSDIEKSVDAYLETLSKIFERLPVISLPPLGEVGASDVDGWIRKLVGKNLIEGREARSIGNRFTRRVLSRGSRRLSEVVDLFEDHERYIWTGAKS